jgi:hypothetical protein
MFPRFLKRSQVFINLLVAPALIERWVQERPHIESIVIWTVVIRMHRRSDSSHFVAVDGIADHVVSMSNLKVENFQKSLTSERRISSSLRFGEGSSVARHLHASQVDLCSNLRGVE